MQNEKCVEMNIQQNKQHTKNSNNNTQWKQPRRTKYTYTQCRRKKNKPNQKIQLEACAANQQNQIQIQKAVRRDFSIHVNFCQTHMLMSLEHSLSTASYNNHQLILKKLKKKKKKFFLSSDSLFIFDSCTDLIRRTNRTNIMHGPFLLQIIFICPLVLRKVREKPVCNSLIPRIFSIEPYLF